MSDGLCVLAIMVSNVIVGLRMRSVVIMGILYYGSDTYTSNSVHAAASTSLNDNVGETTLDTTGG